MYKTIKCKLITPESINYNITKEQIESLPIIVAVDFDGVIVEDKYPAIGQVHLEVIELCKQFRKEGAKLILWTSREGKLLNDAVQFCIKHGLVFDTINDNIPEAINLFGSNSRKVYANIYIDDRIFIPQEAIQIAKETNYRKEAMLNEF